MIFQNWQWDGQVDVPRPKKREAAFIHLTAGDSSSISYIIPMVAGPTGYEPILEVHLDSITVTSSLNDICLVAAESCRVCGCGPQIFYYCSFIIFGTDAMRTIFSTHMEQ
jgi:hypothetical protein